jgi:hypothetical protein
MGMYCTPTSVRPVCTPTCVGYVLSDVSLGEVPHGESGLADAATPEYQEPHLPPASTTG